MAWWLALLSLSKKVLIRNQVYLSNIKRGKVRYQAGANLSVWSLYVLLMSVCVPSDFLPQSQDMQVRLIGDSKLPVGVNVSVNGCLSLYVSPVRNWQLVQGEPRPCPMSAGIGSSAPASPRPYKRVSSTKTNIQMIASLQCRADAESVCKKG